MAPILTTAGGLDADQYPYAPADSLPAYNSSLLDLAGLAGIEVRVLGEVFVAEDFKPSPTGSATVTPRLSVAESGEMSVRVRLAQGSREAAVATLSWTVPGNTKGVLGIDRAIRPHWLRLDSHYENRCILDGYPCWYQRSSIAEDLANYPGESLWLILSEFPAKVPDGAVP